MALICLTEVLKSRYRVKHGITVDHKGEESLAPREDAALTREVEELRERVKVLERITTDANTLESRGSRAIADEIESLRDR